MITKENIRTLLYYMGFTEKDGIFTKKYTKSDSYITVDVRGGLGSITYPQDKGMEIQGNYSSKLGKPEYLVVLECVNYLLDKGYQPSHIVLEPKMEHVISGRADIVIRDNNKNAWMIIECKTSDAYMGAWRKMKVEPGQLFGYAQILPSAKYIMLYASEFKGRIIRKNAIIPIEDNEEYLKKYDDVDIMTYKKAKTQEQKFGAWIQTYKEAAWSKGFFEERVAPFEVGVEKIFVDDLAPVTEEDIQSKYHEFATILRKYNISGRENAFDRLVNLFLCKIVDEITYSDDLQFYWKTPLYDDSYKLQDRLQKLYKEGMRDFLGEDVVYVDNQAIEKTFKFFVNDKNATRERVEDYFKQLKFYKSNDFSFIDVYNERLFERNSEVLIKTVEMLQDIRLTTDTPNQFLGDMFEGFLDQGIKQSEGQFFTPLPIVRFILNSLPIEELVRKNEVPKILDYACGAGHFLTEYGIHIGRYVNDNEIEKYYQSIYGIEKEYRLTKIAKVSSFMYGQRAINIFCEDALKQSEQIKNNSISLIIANPPYSVKGFLETLEDKDRKAFDLFHAIDTNMVTCNNIECFFVERAKQLLKEDGIAAIILPITVLTKGTPKIYIKTREIILKFFEVIGIVELGSGAFGKTNTATCVLFLKRRKTSGTEVAKQYEGRINDWFMGNHDDDKVYGDYSLYEKYCSCIGVPCLDYAKISKDIGSESELQKYEYLTENYKEYLKSQRYKKLVQKSLYIKRSEDEKRRMCLEDFRQAFVEAEKEKMYYYILATIKEDSISCNGGNLTYKEQEVVVVRAPKATGEIKKYLGYEWSAAKNNEGIKYLINNEKKNDMGKEDELDDADKRILKNILNLDSIETPLYDTNLQSDAEKINYYIYSNFIGDVPNRTEELDKYISYIPLVQLMDFGKTKFNKSIDISLSDQNIIESKYPKYKLRNYVDLKGGNGFKKSLQGNTNAAEIPFFKVSDMNLKENYKTMSVANNYLSAQEAEQINATIFDAGTIIFPKAGKTIETNKKRVLGQRAIIDNNIMAMTIKKDKEKELHSEYLYYVFETSISLIKFASLANPPSISLDNIYEFLLPIPEMSIQEQIIDECKEIDRKRDEYYDRIEQLKRERENYIEALFRLLTWRRSVNTGMLLHQY